MTTLDDAVRVQPDKQPACACSDDHGHDHEHDHSPSPKTKPEPAGCGCRSHQAAAEHSHEHGHSHGEEEEGFNWLWRVAVPGAIFVIGLLSGTWLTGQFGAWAFYAVMLTAYIMCGLPVLKDAGRAILRGDYFNEFTLMTLASVVAILIGEVAEAVGVMLFYSIGEAVQDKAAGSSRRSIKSLLSSKPQTAHVLKDGHVTEQAPENVPVGSTVLVRPGDKIPLDGIVLSGRASVDMSSLTGESAPVTLEKDGKAFSGAICLDGDLTINTTATSSDSMVGKILAMVENAVAMKSKTERFITVFARYYTPAVVAAAVLVALVPPLLFSQPWHTWIYRSLVLIMVSCPCALLLSVPLAFFAGIGQASRSGMLVKGGQVFDALARADTVIFDKTGTLTQGRLTHVGTEPAPGVSEGDILRLAAIAESRSNHPVARAVVEAAGTKGKVPDNVTLRDIAGKGVAATTPEGEVLVGNAKLMRDYNIDFAETSSSDVVAYVALNNAYQGCLTFADSLKKDTVEALRSLKSEIGAKLYMLTGDREETAAKVAQETGMDGFRAGLLPDEKVKAFLELSPKGHAVFVGDGVNDAPVLAASGVGIAMGALGSAAAVEAADAVILDDSPAHLTRLFRIAARTRRIAGENIAFSLGVKAVIMILGILGISGLWAAVFADVGVALLAVLNSLRLTRE